jgi:hypothetical protein
MKQGTAEKQRGKWLEKSFLVWSGFDSHKLQIKPFLEQEETLCGRYLQRRWPGIV